MIFFRFLFINIFAFVLVALGVLVFLLPQDIFVKIARYLIAASCAFSGVALFLQWKSKTRKMKVLAARNGKRFRRETFNDIRTTPCGMLMVDMVLRDLRKTENYASLSKAEWKEIVRKAFGQKAKIARKKTASTVGVSANQNQASMAKEETYG